MGDFLLGIQREKKAFWSMFFVSRAVVRGSEAPRRVPRQIWCQKNATFSSCPFWYISTQSLTYRLVPCVGPTGLTPVAARVGDHHAVSGALGGSSGSGGRPRAHRLEVSAESRTDGSW